VRTVALLHDIGKIGIPNEILHKTGPLDTEEWQRMREHPVIGERILLAVPGLERVARAVRHEHERWDGGGYPDGIAGEDIPLASRITLVCDAWHAMTSDRPYRAAMPVECAVAQLVQHCGTQFDRAVVRALLRVLDDDGVTAARVGYQAAA
jgi:HD-GYP domain-containing protein (c-di-GMP phosphodiesterase class II)